MASQYDEQEENQWQDEQTGQFKTKTGNNLPVWGNPRTMNLNHLVLTNIQNSSYFKVRLFELKTYHEVVDEIFYKVEHLEPWERGTRKTAGQTGMCGGVRGVGAGGVVSTAFCCLFKLFTLKLTRKQVNGLLNHPDSPYIRGLGVMYVRYTQPPKDLWDWFEGYLDDDEELDVKSGGGCVMTIGMMIRTVLTKLEWFSTLFPRIPVPIEKQVHENLKLRGMTGARAGFDGTERTDRYAERADEADPTEKSYENHGRPSRDRSVGRPSRDRSIGRRSPKDLSRERSSHRGSRTRTPDRRHRSRSAERKRSRPHSVTRERRRSRERRSRSRERSRKHRHRSRDRETTNRRPRSRSPDRHRSYRSR